MSGPLVICSNPRVVDMVVCCPTSRVSVPPTDDVPGNVIVPLRRLIKLGSVWVSCIPTSKLIWSGTDITIRVAIATILVSVLDDVADGPDALVRLIPGLTVHRHCHFADVVFRHDSLCVMVERK